jgi:Flp pilus assembly pilin Flp
MKRAAGHSLSEFGIVLALIALVTIPALMLLGGNLSSLFGKAGNAVPADPMAMITAKARTNSGAGMAPGAPDSRNPAAPDTAPAFYQQTPEMYQKPIDPSMATMDNAGSNGGRDAVSATRDAANRLRAMARELPEADNVLESRLNNLANLGHQLADMQDQINRMPTDGGNYQSLYDTFYKFAHEYQALEMQIDTKAQTKPLLSSQYMDLRNELSKHGGIIGQDTTPIFTNDGFEKGYITADPNNLPPRVGKSSGQTFTHSVAPVVTDQAAADIRGAAGTP